MQKSRGSTQTFLLDTNMFIAAIKNPERQTSTFQLLLKIVKDPNIKLVGNVLLAHEMSRYAEQFKSKRAAVLISALLTKMELVMVPKSYVKLCKPYILTPDKADVLHAATCLQTGATLITNDRHFDRIKKEGIIEVLSVSKAIKKLL
ncbi:MAG: type II toxin-antitoxin system VapC family toxin [Candidatus Hadarchaeales archaeon]